MMIITPKKLNPLQTEIINIAKNEGYVTPRQVLNRYDITYWTVKHNLNIMEKKKLLIRQDKRRLIFTIK